jgi:uncharacterized cofD-like protein
MAKIVTIGGGKGQPELLRYLASYPHEITAIVSVMDNGGSSGVLRDAYHVLPPGDVRRCMTALSPRWKELDSMWNYRFSDGPLAEHTVGNILLTALTLEYKDMQAAIDMMMGLFTSRGRVLPVTHAQANLMAQLADGTQITGEAAIDVPTHSMNSPIAKLWLEPAVQTTRDVSAAIAFADIIVLTMGDLFTSVLPNLLVGGITEAIASSHARVVAVSNRSTKRGETDGFTTRDFSRVFQQYLAPAKLDVLLVDAESLPCPGGFEAVRVVAPDDARVQMLQRDIANPERPELVSGERVAAFLNELCTS